MQIDFTNGTMRAARVRVGSKCLRVVESLRLNARVRIVLATTREHFLSVTFTFLQFAWYFVHGCILLKGFCSFLLFFFFLLWIVFIFFFFFQRVSSKIVNSGAREKKKKKEHDCSEAGSSNNK